MVSEKGGNERWVSRCCYTCGGVEERAESAVRRCEDGDVGEATEGSEEGRVGSDEA